MSCISKISVPFLLFLTACSSAPKLTSVPSENKIVEIGQKQGSNEITFTVQIAYDGLYDADNKKKLNLRSGIQNGFQTVMDLVQFPLKVGIEGHFPGTTSYDPNWKHYKSLPLQCTNEALRQLQETPRELNLYKKVCSLSTRHLGDMPMFAKSDLVLNDPVLTEILIKQTGEIKEDKNLNGKGDSIRYLVAKSDSDFINGNLNVQRRDLTFHPNNHTYIRNSVLGLNQGSLKIVSTIPVIAASENGYNPIVISNLDIVKQFRKKLPMLSLEEYEALSKRVLDKARKFQIQQNFQECHGGAADDLCLDQFPEWATTQLREDEKVLDIYKRYRQLVKTVDLSDLNGNRNLAELIKAANMADRFNEIMATTWGLILLDNTEINPKRNGNNVDVTFTVHIQKAINQYKTVELE